MLSGKKILSAVLSAALLLPAASALAEDDAFAAEIERRYTAPSIDNRSEVRWWMAEAGHTDETIRAEIQAMYDGGFRGVELCAQGDDLIQQDLFHDRSPLLSARRGAWCRTRKGGSRRKAVPRWMRAVFYRL